MNKSSSRRASRRPNNNRLKRPGTQSAPVATSRRITTRKPKMRASSTSATISHREFIGDIAGSIAFEGNAFALNPGNSLVFPWLSSIALNYESYVFKDLHFHYETSVSTTTAGTVMLAVDYDASDNAPLTKQHLMAYAQAQRSAPWQECAFNCRSGDLTKFAKERYVRDSSPPAGDIKTFDVGNLFLATQGNVSDAIIGELYVSYTVELRTPQVHTATIKALSITQGTADNTLLGGNPTFSINPWNASYEDSTQTLSLTGMTVGATYSMGIYGAGSTLTFANPIFVGATIAEGNCINNTSGTSLASARSFIVTENNITLQFTGFTGNFTSAVYFAIALSLPGP